MGLCALCGGPTKSGQATSIEQRQFYIHSAGQLRLKCYREMHDSRRETS